MYRVKELAAPDGLDYRNVISKPAIEVLYQSDISESLSYLNRYANHVTKADWDDIEEELSNVPELINIEDKNTEIDEVLSPKLTEDPGMQLVAKTLKELVEKLPKIVDEDDDEDPFSIIDGGDDE
jgi:transcription termination factor NusB